jgi:excisionase family DNA binding protein
MEEQRMRLLHTIEDAAVLLGLGRTTVYSLIKHGDLHAIHIGRSARISEAELTRFVAKHDRQPNTPRSRRQCRHRDQPQDHLFEVGDDYPQIST